MLGRCSVCAAGFYVRIAFVVRVRGHGGIVACIGSPASSVELEVKRVGKKGEWIPYELATFGSADVGQTDKKDFR